VQDTEPGVAYAARIFARMAEEEEEDLASEERRRETMRTRDSARVARLSSKVKRNIRLASGGRAALWRLRIRLGVFTF
jgi:hypothetical protein